MTDPSYTNGDRRPPILRDDRLLGPFRIKTWQVHAQSFTVEVHEALTNRPIPTRTACRTFDSPEHARFCVWRELIGWDRDAMGRAA